MRTNPPSGAVSPVDLTAVDLDAFANADEAVPETVVLRAAPAVVPYFDLQLVRPIANGHVRVAGMRVLERVGSGLLGRCDKRRGQPPEGAGRACRQHGVQGQSAGHADPAQQ